MAVTQDPPKPSSSKALRAIVARLKSAARVAEMPGTVPRRDEAVAGLMDPLLAPDHADALGEALAAARHVPSADRVLGCVVGMAIGDAVGAPLEFSPACDGPEHRDPSDEWPNLRWIAASNEYPEGEVNNFRLARGQWTDDASMGLALADSLLAKGGFDGSDARIRWALWWARGYANAFKYDERRGSKQSVGLGGNIGRSLQALVPGERPPPAYEAEREDAGNGSVMRLGAVPARFFNNEQALLAAARASSKATHPGPLAAECCAFLASTCATAATWDAAAVGWAPAEQPARFLETVAARFAAEIYPAADASPTAAKMRLLLSGTIDVAQNATEQCWAWKSARLPIVATLVARGGSYNGYPNSAGYFGSFCMDAIAIALHSVHSTTCFVDAIERCVNFRGDADSTAAVAGQLAGAIYGWSTVPAPLLDQLRLWDRDEVALRALLLWGAAQEDAPAAPVLGLKRKSDER